MDILPIIYFLDECYVHLLYTRWQLRTSFFLKLFLEIIIVMQEVLGLTMAPWHCLHLPKI